MEHYKKYGRNFFSRYDYEEVESEGAGKMIERLRAMVTVDKTSTIGTKHGSYVISECDDFAYVDPVDQSVSKKQVCCIIMPLNFR